MQLLCSIQYRIVKQNADDAFYELQNPKEQIQAYVFDGTFDHVLKTFILIMLNAFCFFFPSHLMPSNNAFLSGSCSCSENDFG